ncbi:Longin-like domain-containing protein [Gymnopilus junonius]|uniref:AP complex subunit sigma n=1 Tax=Gymnopilus junonius TaxID=109634 RepID=A0A9P5P396_GYMJU|nr:Longin-like domain-containing protein [Gymnopilus junonius]
MINYVLLVSKQGKLRLAKWFVPHSSKAKAKIVQDVSQLVLNRRPRTCNFLEYKGKLDLCSYLGYLPNLELNHTQERRCIAYRRYASLFFICEIDEHDNELVTLEIIHRYVELLDKYFGNVCEMDLIFNFEKAYAVLDELVMAGEVQEPSSSMVIQMVRLRIETWLCRGAQFPQARNSDNWEMNDQIRMAIEEAYFV